MADIKDVFSKGITAINMKTANYLEETKIKTYIDTLSRESDQIKMEVANQLYVKWQNGQIEMSEDVVQKFRAIKERQDIIAQKKQEIEQLEEEKQRVLGSAGRQNVVYCTACGSANDAANRFCEKCGNKMMEL